MAQTEKRTSVLQKVDLGFREGTFQPVTALPDQAKISVYLCPQDTKPSFHPKKMDRETEKAKERPGYCSSHQKAKRSLN